MFLNFFNKKTIINNFIGYNHVKNSVFQLNYSNLLKMSSVSESSGPIETRIRQTLSDHLKPIHLEVINESFMHNVPKGSESHFKVLIVSDQFEGVPLIKRHRIVNNLVQKYLEDDFPHAFSIVAKTPAQYDGTTVELSPPCKGGFGK